MNKALKALTFLKIVLSVIFQQFRNPKMNLFSLLGLDTETFCDQTVI